jgi:hypothetical protein
VFAQVAINDSHLLSLIEEIKFGGKMVYVVDVYSDYPLYKPVEARDEGFACVDDAARAAVFFIKYDELLKLRNNEAIIKGLIRFIIKMQTGDGKFYNFLKREKGNITINTDGGTSYASFGWWAARAMWALGEAAFYFKGYNQKIYDSIVKSSAKTYPQLDSLLRNYRKLDSLGNPTWLLYGDGGDATSELVFGLNKLYQATGNKKYINMAKQFCEGMTVLQSKNLSFLPYGLFYSNHEGWHGWANSQAAAIFQYVSLSHDSSMLKNAFREVNYFLPHWVGSLFFRDCNKDCKHLNYSGQIAYAIRPAVYAACEAFKFSNDNKYKVLAALTSSWFFGNNTAKMKMYSSSTGICFDGIQDSNKVNFNSGAESTIEALLTMIALKEMKIDFKSIRLLSPPKFDANSYLFEIDSLPVKIKCDAGGFTLN